MQPFFEKPGAQNTGRKIGTDAQRFQSRAQRSSGHRTIETGHEAHGIIRQRRDHPAQVIRRDTDITVIDQQKLVTRRRQHLRQVADFDVRSQNSITLH